MVRANEPAAGDGEPWIDTKGGHAEVNLQPHAGPQGTTPCLVAPLKTRTQPRIVEREDGRSTAKIREPTCLAALERSSDVGCEISNAACDESPSARCHLARFDLRGLGSAAPGMAEAPCAPPFFPGAPSGPVCFAF